MLARRGQARQPVVLAAANEVEGLTTALSGKTWQKIMILDRTVTPPVD
jgi:hypothetical protein